MMGKILTWTTISLTILFLFIVSVPVAMAGTLSLSPSSGTFSKGQVIKVNVNVSTGGEYVNAVQANVVYPADKLKFSSVSTGGSVLSIIAEKGGGGGYVKIGGGTPTPGFSGNKFIGSINFVALTDSGNAVLSFAGDSVILRDSDNSNIYSGGTTASYTLKAGSSDDTSEAPKVTPTIALEKLSISNLQVTEVDKKSAKVSWTTNIESDSFVEYGFTEVFEFNSKSTQLVTNHEIDLGEYLIPGTTFKVRVKSVDSQGVEAVSDTISFSTLGYPVKIKISELSGVPVKNASVVLYSEPKEAKTNDNGEVYFENVALGEHGLIIKYEGKTRTGVINVLESAETQAFELSFSVSAAKPSSWVPYLIIGLAILLALILVFVFLKMRRKKVQNPPDSIPQNPIPPVPTPPTTIVNQF